MIACNEYWKDLKDDGLAHLNMISLHLSQDTEKNDDKSHDPAVLSKYRDHYCYINLLSKSSHTFQKL